MCVCVCVCVCVCACVCVCVSVGGCGCVYACEQGRVIRKFTNYRVVFVDFVRKSIVTESASSAISMCGYFRHTVSRPQWPFPQVFL